MKTSRFALALSLAALLGGTLVLPTSASAHEQTNHRRDRHTQSDQRQHNREHHRDHYADNVWYLQRHREAQRQERRELRRIHRKEQRQLRRQLRRHHQHEHARTVVSPAPHQHRYPQPHDSYSPLRLQIGYELVL